MKRACLPLLLLLVQAGRSSAQTDLFDLPNDDPLFSFERADVRPAGDVDGDGTPDILVIARRYVRVFSGRDQSVLHTFTDGVGVAPHYTGSPSAAGVGDLNADGCDDIVVGAQNEESVGGERGAVRVYSGKDGALLHEWHGDQSAVVGYSVAGAGDVNGDGRPDVIVSLIVTKQRLPRAVRDRDVVKHGRGDAKPLRIQFLATKGSLLRRIAVSPLRHVPDNPSFELLSPAGVPLDLGAFTYPPTSNDTVAAAFVLPSTGRYEVRITESLTGRTKARFVLDTAIPKGRDLHAID